MGWQYANQFHWFGNVIYIIYGLTCIEDITSLLMVPKLEKCAKDRVISLFEKNLIIFKDL